MTWPMMKLECLASEEDYSFVGGPFGSKLTTRDYVDAGIPVIRGTNLGSGRHLDMNDFVYVTEDKVREDLRSNLARPNDIVFTQRGTLGQVSIIPETGIYDRYVVSQSQMKLTVDTKKADRRYIYYYCSSREGVHRLVSFASSSGVPHINLTVLRNFEVPVPPPETQTRIADILSAYDDLIENNRRRIALLEQAARELYREWFVRLRFPGHEHVKIIDGVPQGWTVKRLEELAEFRLGKMLDQNKNKGDLKPYLANVNVRWGQIDLDSLREMRFVESEIEAFGLKNGDIVMCEGGEPGRCALWKEQLPGTMFQKAIHRIRAHPPLKQLFLYYSLRHLGETEQIAGLFTGATIKHLPREKLALVKICVPTERFVSNFAEQVDPIENQIGLLEAANRKASHARDLLLPRLMNGSIAV